MVKTRVVTISRRFGVGAIDTGQLIAEHYRLVERIGSGGTGVVWRAIDERLQRSVAVKQIHIKPSLPEADRDVMRQRAIREARNAARFQHPNAIVVFDITEHNGDPCLVMEYMKSHSLAAVLSERGILPLAQVSRIGEQVASALITAHQSGIVHRDVKPGNILLDDHGTVKITDFGISRATGDATLTETGLICGTAAYLAPEVARGSDPTPAADVFALGATLFHALEGEPPYGANANPLAVLYAAANGHVSEPRNAGPATDFLLQLLSPDPADRPSMRASRDYLGSLADAGSATASVGFVPASEAFGRRQGHPESGNGAQRPPNAPARKDAAPTRREPAAARNGRPARPAPRRTTTEPSTATQPSAAARPNGASHPRTAAHPRPPARGSGNKRDSGGKRNSGGWRKAVLIGSVVGAAIAIVAITISLITSGGSNPPEVQAGPPSSSSSAGGSSTTTPPLGKTPSSGKVEWGPAGSLVEDYYSDPGASWSMLSPAAQKLYGSKGEYDAYWNSRTVESFRDIKADGGNNSDGSVDMTIATVTVNGKSKSVQVRVIQGSNGKPLIDSDTRFDANNGQ